MNQNKIRIGNFTSSKIVALLSEPTIQKIKQGEIFGAPAKTYIGECNMERKLGRSIASDINSRPTSWGNLIEKRCFDILPTNYILTSAVTDTHPTIDYWAGSKDGLKEDEGRTVIDIKSPFTMKSFCQLSELKTGEDIKENNPDYFWQLISNAIINDCKFAELIICCPYAKELSIIKQMAVDSDNDKFSWIGYAKDYELPYLPNDCKYYKNLNIIRFEVKQEDKDFLTNRVIEAGKLLIKI